MKTILTKLTNEKAQKELRPFTLWAAGLSGLSLIIFWFLGVAGIALGGRALLLTWHKGNAKNKNLIWYRLASALAVVAGIISLGAGYSH